MTVERLPFVDTFEDCSPRYVLLHKVMALVTEADCDGTSVPLLKFMTLLKERFCSGCTLVSFDEAPTSSEASSAILAVSKNLQEQSPQQDYFTGYLSCSDETFLALTLNCEKPGDLTEPYVLILWRKGRIFTPEDIIAVRACVNIFMTQVKSAIQGCDKGKKRMTRADGSLQQLTETRSKSLADSLLAYLYGEALDVVCRCVVITGKDGDLIHMNACAEAIFKSAFEKARDLQSTFHDSIDWIAETLHPDDVQSLMSVWNEANANCSYFTCEFRLLTPSGSDYHMHQCHGKPIRNPVNGQVAYWLFCMFDIEQFRTIEDAKLAATRKSKFLAEMSHEIRTPLACVIGTCSLLKYTLLTSEQNELLDTIRVCSQQLFTLTNNILDLSKLEESKLLIESRPVYLERVLTDVVDIFVSDLVRKEVDVTLNIAYPEVPEAVMSDEGRLRQVVTNILSNAIKFTRENTVISIEVLKIAGPPSKLLLRISDEGPGIPESISPSQLFDTFVQLDASTFRKYGGSGLGLTISKKLVNLLGGEIWYESKLGEGTVMNFTVNLREATQLDLADVPASQNSTAFFRHLYSLREFLHTLSSTSTSLRVLVAMRRGRMNDHVVGLFCKTDGIKIEALACKDVDSENFLIAKIIEREPIILMTDLVRHEDALKKALADSLLNGVILMDGRTETLNISDDKTFKFLRKPVKPGMLVKTLHEMLLNIPSTGTDETFPIGTPATSALLVPESPVSFACPTPKPSVHISPTFSSSFASNYPLRLMLAEDNLLNQQLMTRILSKYGFEDIYVAGDGRKAFEVFRGLCQQESCIDAIFMDMQMPEVEGPEATRLIRQFCHQTGSRQPHAMALTAKAFSEDRSKCLQAGMCTYLSKPVCWTTLEEELMHAFQAANDLVPCTCNAERIDVALEQAPATSDIKSSGPSLPISKSTGLDV